MHVFVVSLVYYAVQSIGFCVEVCMPIYELVCTSLDCPKHNLVVDKLCRFDDIPHCTCGICGKTLTRLVSATFGVVRDPASPKRG